MRLRFIAMLAVVLVCLAGANAQTVNEAESSAVLGEEGLTVIIAYENFGTEFDSRLTVQLLDADGNAASKAHKDLRIRTGRKKASVLLPLDGIPEKEREDLMWYRVRYRLGSAHGIASISQMIRDFFEISVASPDTVKAGQRFRTRVRANDPFKKLPVQGVRLKARLELDLDTDDDEDTLELTAEGKTDSDGIATLEFNIPDRIRIDYANDLEITAEKFGFVREVEVSLDELESAGILFMTVDKPIYQPGQSFNVRALLFDTENAVIAGGELEFSIYDEEETLLYRETVNSSDYGVAYVSWQIPENAKLGTYKVEVEGDDDVQGGVHNFKVTRYDLPNFTVSAKPDKPFYLPSDATAKVTVSGDYLFGKPVAKGRVRVVQENERKWNWAKQAWDIEEARAFEGEADPEGKFIAEIEISEKLAEMSEAKWKRFEDLHLAAYFTDLTTNRTEQRRFDIRLSKEPIHVYLSVREYGLNAKLPVAGYVSAFYADGTPTECEIRLEAKGETEPVSSFAELAAARTNRFGAGKMIFSRPELPKSTDDLDIRITARDASGAAGTFEDTLYFSDDPGIALSVDRAIRVPGEPIRIDIRSTFADQPLFVDVVRDWSVVASANVRLTDGKASIEIPYSPDFSGDLQIWAYGEYTDEDQDVQLARAAISVIYPKQQNLLLDTQFTAPTYEPGEEAKVSFAVRDGSGRPAQSALGVVVFDKAVEERARTDAEFGNYFSRFDDWLGYSRRFGSTTLKDLNDLDLTKPIPEDLQLTAEFVLLGAGGYYRPEIERSEIDLTEPEYFFSGYFKTQFDPVESALKKQFDTDYSIATDEDSFAEMLSRHGIRFAELTDPWGQHYRPRFSARGKDRVVEILSAGADKRFGTKDDLDLKRMTFEYFRPIAEKIRQAAIEMRDSGRGFIRDKETLKAELARLGVDLDSLRDPWGREYRFTFDVFGRNFTIEVDTAGEDGKFEQWTWQGDDSNLLRNQTDYFSATEAAINRALSIEAGKEAWKFPETEQEFWEMLRINGIERDGVTDGYGRTAYVSIYTRAEYSDKTSVTDGKVTIKPMTEVIRFVELRSPGKDGVISDGTQPNDDFTLAKFASSEVQRLVSVPRSSGTITRVVYTGSNGAISGRVTDQTGAAIPGALVTASDESRSIKRSSETNDSGVFLIENLPSGNYRLVAEAAYFQTFVYSDVRVRAYSLTEFDITLSVGDVTAMVDVSAGALELTVNTSDASISTTYEKVGNAPATGAQMETPRLREYFPETLVWQPELITDKNGKAELKFKMADNITTWKMYTVASTMNGKIGVSEKEVQAFKPFFADLEPPKFLTTGDEIYLPVQIRNYTPSAQPVNVTMSGADWFSFLGPDTKTIEVAANTSENAVFGFRAEHTVEGGKQRVTAIAKGDSDAIEKPVTVRPNGQEITSSESTLFSESASFRIDFPADAIPEGREGRLRLYPNLLANVADAADGLLQRPYGCGEQTISSTYPNLMILKLAAQKSPLRAKAEKFLRQGFDRLLGYQDSSGGFTYWGREGTADLSLTAYAIRFLKDAEAVVDVDGDVIGNAERWLISQQRPDGSWTHKYSWEREENLARTKMITSYVVRSLAMSRDADAKENARDEALRKGLAYLKSRNSEIDEPYAMALYGLASLDAGYSDEAAAVASRLEKMMIAEGNAGYWKLETNTPFYGWGTAGRIETTALVVHLLERTTRPGAGRSAIRKGTMFLMKNKDRYGVWYSTQTTINVLDALIATLDRKGTAAAGKRTAEISVNGKTVRSLELPPSDEMAPAMDIDLTNELGPAANAVSIVVSDDGELMAQIVGTHYIDWRSAIAKGTAKEGSASDESSSRLLELDYSCDRQSTEVMGTVFCSVRAERVGFRGYGMLLAEIGIPPGADVSHESLEKAMESRDGISRYDILPDRLIVYMWANPGGTKFDFSFRPRYAIDAQTPSSVVYDYYNDEARAVVAPLRFSVR